MLSSYSVKKPFTIVVAVIAVLMLGVLSFTQMTVDLLPSIDLPYVVVVTTYPGASPDEVEESVTKPLESSLATISNLAEISSVSSDNSSMVMLEFSQDTNMDTSIIETNAAIDMVSGAFPDGVSSPIVMRINPDMLPIMMVALSAKDMDPLEVAQYTDDTLLPRLERIEGVGAVSAVGLFREQLEVVISQEKIDKVNARILGEIDEELAEQEDDLRDARYQISKGKDQLEVTKKQKYAELDTAEKAVDDGLSKINAAAGELDKSADELESQEQLLTVAYEAEKAALARAIEEKAKLEAKGGELTDTEKLALEALNASIPELEACLAETEKQYNELKGSKAALDAQRSQLAGQKSELEKQKTALTDARATMDAEFSKAEKQLSSAQSKISSALSQFDDAREQAFEQASLDGVITVSMVSGLLTAENFAMPAGYINDQGLEYLVNVGDKLSGVEEAKKLLLFSLDLETVDEIYLEDVADVNIVDNSGSTYAKVNGEGGVLISFQKQSSYSTAEVSEAIQEELDRISASTPGVSFYTMMDQGVYIKLVTDSVLSNLLYGAALAILVLLLFMRSAKPTVIIAVSIPFSVVFAFVLMYFSGVTLNIISLSGLALAVGMLVDNSIVVIENTYRLRREGVPPKEAAIEGAKQVAGAVTASTLTTVCVFLPIVFTTGITRQLFTDMGLTITYSLLASLIVALTLVPALSSGVFKNVKQETDRRSIIYGAYERLLRRCLKFKPIVLLLAVGALAACSWWALAIAGTSFMPSMDGEQMSASMTFKEDMTFEEMCATADEAAAQILDVPDIEAIGVMHSGSDTGTGGGSMSMYIILGETERTNDQIAADISQRTAELPCELSITTSNMDMSALYGEGIQLVVRGIDSDELLAVATDLQQRLSEIEGIGETGNTVGETTNEVRITVNKNEAMKYGLTVAQIYMTVAEEIASSETSTTIMEGSRELPIVVINGDTEEFLRKDIGDITFDVTVKNDDGETEEKELKLSEIAEITEGEGQSSIRRMQQSRYITVSADIAQGYNLGHVTRDVEAMLADYQLPDGYTITMEGESEATATAVQDLIYMIAVAVVLVYLIMVAQFQSLLSPFIVLMTIPLALTGGLLALMLTGFDVSVISLLGFLVLAGVVVNNGIVLIDCVYRLRSEGMTQTEALVHAGKLRMRPIFMTAITTILGLTTMALGIGDGAELVQPMAIVAIGGLIYSTLLTLIVIPALYDLFNRKERRQAKRALKAGGGTDDTENIQGEA